VTTYLPGSFFLARISGVTGYLIQLGQAIAGDGSRWTHAGIVLDADGTVLEAEPGGARIANLSEYAGRPLLISDAPVQTYVAGLNSGTPNGSIASAALFGQVAIRKTIVTEAQKLVGVPYSALDYLALALLHLHLPSSWVRNRVEWSGHMICSQLVDAIYERAGLHLFTDGRLPGDVAPADLAAYAEDYR
jgi:hypothetical protein